MKWYHRIVRYPELWVLTVVALITRLWQIGWPQSIVFDEVYFRTFASDYLNGHYYFDVHPPLVKLLFAGIGSLFHLTADQVAVGDPGGIILRVIPALAGAALVPLIYVILRQLHFGRRVALLGGILVLFDNALLVESRFVLMDSLLLLAGFGAISAYLALRSSEGVRRWMWVVLVAVLLGMLVGTKWSGLAIGALIAVVWVVDGVKRHWKWPLMVGEAVTVLSIVACIYIGSFMVSFSLLTKSGEGDAFMSDKFQSTLIGNPNYDKSVRMPLWDKFIELNLEMYRAQSSLSSATHPYASKWYSWPVMGRSVYYWQGDSLSNKVQGNIYLLGNPAVWLLGGVSVITALIVWLSRPKLLGARRNLVAFLLLGYALNFVPFAFIDRPMFLYHYLFALVISILLTCVLAALVFDWQTKKYGRAVMKQTFWGVVAVIVLGFLYFSPLSYGWPLSPGDLQQRIWFPGWR